MTSDDPILRAVEAVDRALPPGLFTPPQGSGDGRSVIWCSPWKDMQAHFPLLPNARQEPETEEERNYYCDDLTVAWDRHGRLERLDLKGWGIDECFEALGDGGSATIARDLVGADAAAALTRLAGLLPRLFELGSGA